MRLVRAPGIRIPKRSQRLRKLALACLILLVGACHRPKDSEREIAFRIDVDPKPARVGPTTVTVRMTTEKLKPLVGADVALEADMSHAGMSPVFGKASEVAPGLYRARLDFSMGGDWVILVHGTFPDGRKIERQVEVKGVRPE